MDPQKTKSETHEVIVALMRLFAHARRLCKNEPQRDPTVWKRCQDEARQKLREESKKRWQEAAQATVDLSWGCSSDARPSEPKDFDVECFASEKYRQVDKNYIEAWHEIEAQMVALAKRIDHSLYPIQDMFLNWPRVKGTLLVEKWGRIRDQSDAHLAAKMLEWSQNGAFDKTVRELELFLSEYDRHYGRALTRALQEAEATLPHPSTETVAPAPDQEPNGPVQPGRKGDAPMNVTIQNSNVVTVGSIHQAQSVAAETHNFIVNGPQTRQENKKGIKKTIAIVSGAVVFFAALLECLSYLGWLDPIKQVIKELLVGR